MTNSIKSIEIDDATVKDKEDPPIVDTEEPTNADAVAAVAAVGAPEPTGIRRHLGAYLIVPLLVMITAVGAGYLKYQDATARAEQAAAITSTQAAIDGTIALLSYRPDTVEATLTAAKDRLTGQFRDSYTSLTHDVVIPGAKEKNISATATVPAAASISATENHAVVLVFVDQTVIVGNDAPSATASAVQVTLDKSGDRWLISGFDPK
jgi:Mce-associated membrane protein